MRRESRSPVVHRILAGHMYEGPEYATFRSTGTKDWLLIYTMAGSGRFGGETGEVRAVVGDAVLLRPLSLHDYGTGQGAARWELLFAHFHPRSEWLPLLEWPQPAPGISRLHIQGTAQKSIVTALQRAARMHAGALQQSELFAVNALEEALLWCDTQNPINTRIDGRVLAILDYVDSHLTEPFTVARLATHVHLSPSRLTHLFSTQVGTSPQRYVERQRMTRAMQLLDLTARPVATIAHDLGWHDELYFSRRFRQFTGLSPMAYRRRT